MAFATISGVTSNGILHMVSSGAHAASATIMACTPENPRETKAADFEKILKACYYDTDIDF